MAVQTKEYKFCNYSIMSGVTVTLDICCPYDYDWTWTFFGQPMATTHQEMELWKFSIPTALPEDLKVYYSSWSKNVDKGVVTYEGRAQIPVTIPAGQTEVVWSGMTYLHMYNVNNIPPTDPSYIDLYQWQSGVTLDNQVSLPVGCTTQPTGCTIQTSSVVINSPSVRGAADGSIEFTITGNQANDITYQINGVTAKEGGGNSYTFTGLTTGFYTIIAYEGFCYAQEADLVMPDGQFYTSPFTVTTPASITAVNNPVVLQLQTAVNSINPQPAKARLKVNGTVAVDTTIKFSLNYPQPYEAVFTAKGFPDSNIKFLATDLTDANGVVIGSNTTSEIATSIAECLQQDVVLRRLYYITNSEDYVSFVAREATPNLNLTTAQVTIGNLSISLITDQYGISRYQGQLTGDYSLYAEVFVNPALEYGASPVESDYVRVAELQLPYQRDNIHRFQVETILKNYVNATPPDFTFTGFTTVADYDCSYFIKYGEIFPLIANSETKKKRYKNQTGFLHTVNAALDYESSNNLTAYLGEEIPGYTPSGGRQPLSGVTFLTNSPQTLYVQRNSKQFLSFILPKFYATPDRTLSCRGDVYFYNGTSQTGMTFFQITSGNTTNFGGMTLLSVGYDGLGLAALENNGNTKVRRVDFAVYNNDSNGSYPLTDVKTYIYEIDEAPTKYGVCFLNKLGTWDIFDFVGEVIYDEDVSREAYQVPREIRSDGSSPKGFIANSVYNTQYTPKVTLNSGTIDAQTYIWLQELLQSNRIYSYTNPHQNFMIVESFIANKSTNVNEFTLQVVLKETLYENNISV